MCMETCWMIHHQENKPRTKLRLQFSTTILNYATSIMLPQTWSLLNLVRCFPFLKITKRWTRWSSRAEVQQWDTYPKPTELLLIGYLTESILDPQIQIKYVDTNNQLADILTKGNFTLDEWNNLLHLVNISIFSSASCPEAMSKRMQQGTREERIVATSKPTLNLVSRSVASYPTAPSSSASSRPGILRAPSQQGSNLTAQCAGKPAAGGSNQNDAASSSQVWLTDAKMSERARKLAAAETNQNQSFQERARKLAAENFRYQRRGRLEVAAQSPHISC